MQFSTLHFLSSCSLFLYSPNIQWEFFFIYVYIFCSCFGCSFDFHWMNCMILVFGLWVCVMSSTKTKPSHSSSFLYFVSKHFIKSGTLLLILLYYYIYVIEVILQRVCVCEFFFVKFMCHSHSIENYSDYLVFELNSNTSYLGYINGLGWGLPHKGSTTTKRGWYIWHWCNTKTTCIQTH